MGLAAFGILTFFTTVKLRNCQRNYENMKIICCLISH